MSDERPESLAEQAAGWVPPWERPGYVPASARPVEPAPAEADTEPEADAESEAAADAGAGAESEPAADAGAGAESEAAADAESAPTATPVGAGEAVDGEAADADAAAGDGAGSAADGIADGAAPDEPVSARDADSGAESEAEAAADAERGADAPADDVASAETDGGVEGAREVEAGGGGALGTVVGAAVGGKEKSPEHALALIDDGELRGALEAVLLVVDEPVSEIVLAQVLEQPTERIAAMLTRIAEDYTSAGHGFELRRAAGGWRLYTRPAYAAYVERFVLDGQSVRLTQAALETLAVIAYKQPVTRSRISAIRGVNCDGVIRTLVSRGLVEECGTEPETGAHLYRTTVLFLEKLGLNTVDELPPLAPFLPDDVDEFADVQ